MSTAKLYMQTHGCQMNEYDSNKLAEIMAASPHQMSLTPNPGEADMLLLNTCAVREKPEEKVFSELGRWRKLKQQKPDAVIVVSGCVASQEGEAIIKRSPIVDIVIGPQTIHRLPELYDQVLATRKPVVDITFPEIEKFDHLPTPNAEGPSAFVSIMEGCSKFCSFCIVPYTRGKEVSRPFDDVLAEVVQLADQGVREINLLGQNVNDYRGPMSDGGTADLALLIHYIAEIDNIARIRYTTSHPAAFSDNLIEAYAEIPKLANHLHLPVQSGSDRILAAMKRGYTTLEYKSKIRKLRKARPDISLSSDFIIGFPGETNAEFEATMALIHELDFDHSFSFIYSRRPGTPAASLADEVSLDEKKARLKILQTRIIQNTQRFSRQMVGTTQPLLVTGTAKRNPEQMISGRTENNRVVNFVGPQSLIGQMVSVKITNSFPNSLAGEWLGEHEVTSAT